MLRKIILFSLVVLCLGLLLPIIAQDTPKVIPIEKALEAKNYAKADSIFKQDVTAFISAGNLDTLLYYIPIAGKIASGQSGAEKSAPPVFALIETLKVKNAPYSLLVKACRTAADFFSNVGQYQHGYDASKEALEYTMKQPGHTDLDIAKCEYNLGIYAHRLGNIGLSQVHQRRAMQIRQADKNTDPEDIYLSANGIGALMWYASKYDSAALFFTMALDALKKMPANDLNNYFRPGNVLNNLAALYSAEGKTTEAIKAMQMTIDDFQKFIASKKPDPKKQSATEGLFEAIDNLAGIYKEIGDYGKAGDLLRYSYQQKLKKLNTGHTGIFISEILLGQHYNSVHEYDSALHYLTIGLEKLEKAEGDYLFWAADAYYALALVYENKKDNVKAEAAYAKSESLYEESYQGEYDNVYMDFLRSASLFYANNNNYPKAFERAEKVYNYLLKVGEGASLQSFYQLLNIAEINYLSKRYPAAIEYSNTALTTVNAKMKAGHTLLDSVKIEVFKPKAILINAKAIYAMRKNKDSNFLQSLSLKLNDALHILEKRKVLIDDEESIDILIADHQELINFAEKIELELYESTGRSQHLDQFINLHESALYNRIRSRLDKQKAIQFGQLPVVVQKEEQEKKEAIKTSLQGEKPNSELMRNYVKSVSAWEEFLKKVKTDFPAYYNMRYATIFRPLPELQSSLADSNTVVRYFETDCSLTALVIDKKNKNLVHINTKGLEEKIDSLFLNTITEKQQLSDLHNLYTILWQPVEAFIHTKKVTIIPDGTLYNLSFEMLTGRLLDSYKDLSSASLLSRYLLSYHYSLFMLGQSQVHDSRNENYVAFAPGFSDEIKNKYLSLIKDSVDLDYRYLNLLPQPNANKLAKEIKGMLGGDIYLNEMSTQSSFRKNAGGHKIIYIGTHAEYNNVHPEQSGLIFAKNGSSPNDTNYLSLYDIYNCNMKSDLTLLTACESGRPGYQDGEGMVSLAHAFNYAGSQRILTALWKIDEESSSMITEFFIKNLKKGFPTDKALQQAKLEYLQNAEGRMKAPVYWAGLVMMGEPTQLLLNNPVNYTYWIIGAVAFFGLALLFFIMYQRRKKNPGT